MEQIMVIKALWDQLNAAVDEIQDPKTPPRDIAGMYDLDYRPKLLGKAQGLAIAIAALTGQTYEFVRDEAGKLWDARQ